MEVKTARRAVLAGGGTLSIGAVVFLLQTFALKSELIDTRKELAETRGQLKETIELLRQSREDLMVVRTIVMQRQDMIAKAYE